MRAETVEQSNATVPAGTEDFQIAETRKKKNLFEQAVDFIKDSATEAASDIADVAEDTIDNLKKNAPAGFNQSRQILEDTAETVIETTNEVLVRPLKNGTRELIEQYLPAPVDESQKLEQAELTGIYRVKGEKRPEATDLTGGFYALPGFLDNNGKFRSVLAYPTSGRQLTVENKVEEGDIVKKGDILFYEKDPVVEGMLDQAKVSVQAAKANLDTAIQRAPLQVGQFDAQLSQAKGQVVSLNSELAALDSNIVLQDNRIALTQNRLSAFENVAGEGAISARQVEVLSNELTEAKQELSTMKSQRAGLVARVSDAETLVQGLSAQKSAVSGFIGKTPDQIIDQFKSGDAGAFLPNEVRAAAQGVIATETTLVSLENTIEDNTTRATMDGVVAVNFPEASTLNRLNGTYELGNSSGTALGTVSDDPERRVPQDGNDGGTIGLVPLPDTQSVIQIMGVSSAQRDQFAIGDTVAFQTLTGKVGNAKVVSNEFTSNGAGYRVYLDDPKLDDGSLLTSADRGTLRVFATEEPTLARTDSSSENVSFSKATVPTYTTNQFRVSEQEVVAKVPVYRRTQLGGTDQIGTVEISFTVKSDGRIAEINENGLTATALSKNGTSVNLLPDLKVQEFPSGSTMAGSAKADSGRIIRVAVGLTEDNKSFTNTDTKGINFGVPGNGGNASQTNGESRLPDATQYQIPIDVVPTGKIEGSNVEIARVVVPAALIIED